MTNCSLGFSPQISGRDQSKNFYGQFGVVYIFGESLPANAIAEIYSLGPSYFHNFIHSAEDGFGSRYFPLFMHLLKTSHKHPFSPVAFDSKTLFDGKLGSKIIVSYNAKACVKPHCWDNTPVGNMQYFLNAKKGSLKPGTIPVTRSNLKTVIQVVGGVKSIFPLFSQLGKILHKGDDDDSPESVAEGETNSQIIVTLIGILAGLLHKNTVNQKDMLDGKGFMILAFMLENVWKHHTRIETAIALKKTVLALVPTREWLSLCYPPFSSCGLKQKFFSFFLLLHDFPALTESARTVRDTLQIQLYQRMFFNWDIWIHADANVQRQLLSDLTMQATENAVIDFRGWATTSSQHLPTFSYSSLHSFLLMPSLV